MQVSFIRRVCQIGILVMLMILVAACHFGRSKADTTKSANVPTSFDLTIIADKDNQFDVNNAPLTVEDLKSHLRYLKEEAKPVQTILLKRGEKQKVKDQHIVDLARVAHELGIHAYVENDGVTQEIRAVTKKVD